MNESQFRQLWESEKPIYRAWGDYVVRIINQELENREKKLENFIKIPPKPRIKDDDSLIDKAFYRPEKPYTDPYNEIEDKVGARYVVLLLDDINLMCSIIDSFPGWRYDACKHFEYDKKRDPLLFTYQSVHYILRPANEIIVDGITIPTSTPCEVQIRTLLQHAHAELTHDEIYKSKNKIRPEVHRTVAKSMALIETTDEFFKQATQLLNYGPLQEYNIPERLDRLYLSITGIAPHSQKSSISIWNAFERFIDDNLIDSISAFVDEYEIINEVIAQRYNEHVIYQQSTILFVYWLLAKKKARLLSEWPLSRNILEYLAVDLGISIQV